MVVGGYAVAFYGYPRFTGDFDVWVEPSDENLQRIMTALDEFGYEISDLEIVDFESETIAFHIGTPPVRIDIMNKISGVNFQDCFGRKETRDIDGVKINYISYQDLLSNKKAAGRLKDLDDLENLK